MVGWGEGLDIVTDYLNQKPDAERLTVAGFYPRVMSAQFKGTRPLRQAVRRREADYIVLYVNALQRDLANRLRMVTRGKRTEMVVKINGIEYARLFPVPPPPRRNAAGTEFGGQLRLERTFLRSDERRYLKSDDLNPGDTIEMTLRWTVLRPVDGRSPGRRAACRSEGGARRRACLAGRRSGQPLVDHAGERHRHRGAPHRRCRTRSAEYNVVVGLRRPNGEWLDDHVLPGAAGGRGTPPARPGRRRQRRRQVARRSGRCMVSLDVAERPDRPNGPALPTTDARLLARSPWPWRCRLSWR